MKRIAELKAILQKQNMKYESILDTIFIQSKLNVVKWKIKKKLTKNIDISKALSLKLFSQRA